VALPGARLRSTAPNTSAPLRNCGSACVSRNCNTSDSAINTNLALPLHQSPYSLTNGRVNIHRTYLANMNLRKAPASSMQKTYDECYLTCSTAIYFEGQVG